MSITKEPEKSTALPPSSKPDDDGELIELEDVFDSSDYTLSLQNIFNNNLISEFEAEWSLRFNLAEIETADIEGIIPKRYEVEEDSQNIYYIYGQSTSDDIARPSFEILDNLGIESSLQVSYTSQELSSLKTVYQKQSLSGSIKSTVSSISANIYAKMNLNIEQNLNFQKSKVKKIGFKKTSIFEKQPEVSSVETTTNIIITTPVTQGNY